MPCLHNGSSCRSERTKQVRGSLRNLPEGQRFTLADFSVALCEIKRVFSAFLLSVWRRSSQICELDVVI